MTQYAPNDGAMARLENEKSRPSTTTTTDGSHFGAGDLLAPEIYSPPLVGDIRDRDGTFAGVRREADGSPSWAFTPMTCAAVFKAVASFYPSLHHFYSQADSPYPDKYDTGMGGSLWSDKSVVEIQQIE